ncbi:hypothetical protein AURDEDRAFT_166763 [Auricularia subglabra TFB-10046 SS5]|nr:hypothetical protein AURDEDRAFT_166763 [Auricularia subglabra TFB-10046 SS5]
MPDSETAPDIIALCQWLGRKGMNECLVEHVQPGTPLFTIPDSALLNLRTLWPLYPSLYEGKTRLKHGLTGIQLLAIHLFAHPPPSVDPHFGPYIDSLPTDFGSHPLTWRIRSEADQSALKLWESIPSSIQRAVDAVKTRFMDDWRVVEPIVSQLRTQGHLPETWLGKQDSDLDRKEVFLWAWLCVNTRSIYYGFSPSPVSTYNVTLCPLLDFANHPTDDMSNSGSSVPTFHAPAALAPGDEAFLNYGGHPDTTLFAEYGFVTGADARAQVDVGPELEPLFAGEPAKRELLERHDYWGEWTLHLAPLAHPSYRTMTALRLLAVEFLPGGDPEQSTGFKRWLDTVNGAQDFMPEPLELAARQTLETLCQNILKEAEERLSHFGGDDGGSLHALWQERHRVAAAVLQASRRGDEF